VAPERQRWIVANLDCELDFPEAYSSSERLGDRPVLSPSAQLKIKGLATLLRALGNESDRILPPGEDLLPIAGVSTVLAWAETPAVERLRHRLTRASSKVPGDPLPELPLRQLLWKLPIPSATSAARSNHRSFHFDVSTRLGIALPGAAMIHSADGLERALVRIEESGSRPSDWVLKTPFSAAGRDRQWLVGGRRPTPRELRRLQGSLARCRSLVLEPWMHRVADFACCAVVTERELRIVSLHQQIVSDRGAFRGLRLEADPLTCPALEADEIERLIATAERVGEALLATGYCGPFGIDAWRYRDADGSLRFQPLGEINARLTFGFVGRCWHEKLVESGQLPPGSGATLHLVRPPAIPPTTIQLGPDGWIEPSTKCG